MRQEVNLFQPMARAQSKLFSAASAAVALGLVLAASAAIWGYGAWQVSRLAEDIEVMRRQQQAVEERLGAAGQAPGAQQDPSAVEAHVKQMTAELLARRRVLEMLRSGAAGQPVGFAARFEALARAHTAGVWLDHVLLSGGAMNLSGGTLDPDLVPRYLRALAAEPVLAGVRFDEFTMEGVAAEQTKSPPSADPTPAAASDRPAAKAMIRFRAASTSLPAPAVQEQS